MTKPCGKSVSISPFRKLVIDLLILSKQVPGVTLDRRMKLGPLVAARQNCEYRPMWTSMFIKAYAIVAKERPLLRQSYMTCPWARFYEHPVSIATFNISRKVDGEDVVLQAQIRRPENRSLGEIDAIVRRYQETPVEEIKSYLRVRRVSYLPAWIRQSLMWATFNLIGRRRCHNFGTFAISSVADRGAGILNMTPLLTSTLHYGLFDDKGNLDVRYAFDHRVLDGAPAAEALVALEDVLLGEVLAEVKALGRAPILPLPLAA